MKKVIVGLLMLAVAGTALARYGQDNILLDISKDPVYSDTVLWKGGEGGILVPTHTSASVQVQVVGSDMGAGGLPLIPDITSSNYKLLLYCAETTAVSVLTDHSSSSNNFTATDTADNFYDASGQNGYAFDLAAGTNVTAARADDADFDLEDSADAAFGCWFKHATISTSSDYIYCKLDGTGNTETGFAVYMDSDGDIAAYLSDDGGVTKDIVTTSAQDYDDDAWHHLIVTIEDGANVRLYIDGKDRSVTAMTNAAGDLSNTAGITLGGLKAATSLWEGHLDNIFFISGDYPTANEVREHYAEVVTTCADVDSLVLPTGTVASYIGFGGWLDGYAGYIRLKFGAVQAADRTTILHYQN